MLHNMLTAFFLIVYAILFFRTLLYGYQTSATRVARIGVFSALAIVLGILESLIPDFIIPGVKIGFPNIVVLYLLCHVSYLEALGISLLRVVVVGLLRGNLFQMGGIMSFAGALLSFMVMATLHALSKKRLSPIFLSCVGALSHGLAQLFVGALYLGSFGIFYYYPLMGLLSLFAGALSGALVMILSRRLRPLKETH